MVLRKLIVSNLIVHRVRAALTIAPIALSVSLVVSVSSGARGTQLVLDPAGYLRAVHGTVGAISKPKA